MISNKLASILLSLLNLGLIPWVSVKNTIRAWNTALSLRKIISHKWWLVKPTTAAPTSHGVNKIVLGLKLRSITNRKQLLTLEELSRDQQNGCLTATYPGWLVSTTPVRCQDKRKTHTLTTEWGSRSLSSAGHITRKMTSWLRNSSCASRTALRSTATRLRVSS
jgi:hypothetical protein